jgi:hypothetical protein
MQALEKPPLNEGETYIGFISDHKGEGHHVILLPGDNDDATWQSQMDWAEKQGGSLPTRAEQSLLFANLKGEFQGAYYWSGQQHETNSGWAWYQVFGYGYQYNGSKSLEFRARAVRRLVIE